MRVSYKEKMELTGHTHSGESSPTNGRDDALVPCSSASRAAWQTLARLSHGGAERLPIPYLPVRLGSADRPTVRGGPLHSESAQLRSTSERGRSTSLGGAPIRLTWARRPGRRLKYRNLHGYDGVAESGAAR